MILLDTNICIYIINTRPPEVLARFHRFRLGDIGLSSIVAAELTYGVAKRVRTVTARRWKCFLRHWKYSLSMRAPFGLMASFEPISNAAGNR